MKETAKYIVGFLLFLALGGCGPDVEVSNQRISSPPAIGISSANAVKFLKDVSLRDHAINHYNFAANSEFIRRGPFKQGIDLYCGPYTINDDNLRQGCFGFGQDLIVIGPNAGFKEKLRSVPPSTFKFVKR